MGMSTGHESINESEAPSLLQENKPGGWSVVPTLLILQADISCSLLQ